MTDSERTLVRSKLFAYTQLHTPVRSVPMRAWQWVGRHSVLALGLVAVVLAGGTGVSANLAQPGDPLYGVRLTINDRVETALAFDDEAQIDVQMSQMQRMIDAEEALGDEELNDAELNSYDEDLEQELSDLENEISDEDRQRDADLTDDEDGGAEDIEPIQFDDGSFERELRDIELELRDEDRARSELE